MRPALLITLLAMAPAAMAQTAPPIWSGANLVVTGTRENGCDVRLMRVRHMGGTANPIQVEFFNEGGSAVRINADIILTGQGQTASRFTSQRVDAMRQGTLTGPNPFHGPLVGSRLSVIVSGCPRA